jgi:hypothetical protein
MMRKPTRRKFMQQTSAASLSLWTAASAQRILGANDRVRIGFVGVGNRGDQVLDAFVVHPDAQIISIADVNQPIFPLQRAKQVDLRHWLRTTARFWTRRTSMQWSSPLRTIGMLCK